MPPSLVHHLISEQACLLISSSLGEKISAEQLHWCLMLSSESLPCWTYNDNLSDLCNTNKNIWNANPGPKKWSHFCAIHLWDIKIPWFKWCFFVHVGPSKPGLNLLHILQLILHCTGISTGERITPSNDIATFGESSKSCMCRLNVLHVFPKASTLNAGGRGIGWSSSSTCENKWSNSPVTHPNRNSRTLILAYQTLDWCDWDQLGIDIAKFQKKKNIRKWLRTLTSTQKNYQTRTKSQLILNMIAVTSRYCISPSHNMACSQNRSKGTTCGLDLLHISQLIFHTRIPRFWAGLQSAHGNSHTWVPNSKNHLCCYFCLYFGQIWII